MPYYETDSFVMSKNASFRMIKGYQKLNQLYIYRRCVRRGVSRSNHCEARASKIKYNPKIWVLLVRARSRIF